MVDAVAGYALQYGVYALEVGLLGAVVWRRYWARHAVVVVYVASLVALDAVERPWVLYHYGFKSTEYAYSYWLTNTLLQFGAFLLVCSLFRAACARERRLWDILKQALPLVFVLVLAISIFSIWRNYGQLQKAAVIYPFEQYLYFTCLVLNTLLFIMMQYVELEDDALPMLVCGLGLQFAGPAAGMALLVVTRFAGYAKDLAFYIDPLCTSGMLLTWLYAVTRVPRTAPRPVREEPRTVEQAA